MKLWLQEKLGPKRGGTRKMLAAHLGVKPEKITRWANTEPGKESHSIPADVFLKMRSFFNDSPVASENVFTSIPIMGFLGAGAEVEPDYEQIPPEGLDTIEIPFTVPADMIAFKVIGTSMMPGYRPDAIVVVHREQRRPLESFYGLEAAVRTSDGRRFVKTINRGSIPGTVNLISWNDLQPIENVRLEWIGEIFAVLPPSALRPIGSLASFRK